MRFHISKNVFILGIVSFFNDISSEMVYPIIPIFLTNILGTPVAIIGLIEGVAESTASILKVISGWISDIVRKRKVFVVTGYLFSAISKICLGLANAWPLAFIARFIDRFGKGMRTPSRDALITENSDLLFQGRAFGFHRALDTMGAVIGPLLALLVLKSLNNNLRLIFFIATIPASFGIILLLFFVKEIKKEVGISIIANFKCPNLDRSFRVFLLVGVIFSLGNSSDAFLILRARNLGVPMISIIVLYVLFNLTYAIFSTPAGMISDKIGPKRILLVGLLCFSLIYLLFGIINRDTYLWFLFPLYGIYMALTEGVGKAYISNLVRSENLATAFGIYQTFTGISTFFASFIAGMLWSYLGTSAAFIFGSIMALTSAFLFIVLQ